MELVIRQTCIDPDLIQVLKDEAADRSIFLQDLYEEAFLDFLESRSVCVDDVVYLASPRDGKELNIKIRPSLFARLDQVARQDKMSLRRLLFTALYTYANMLEAER